LPGRYIRDIQHPQPLEDRFSSTPEIPIIERLGVRSMISVPIEAWIVGLLAIGSILYGFLTLSKETRRGDATTTIKAAIWAFWAVLPPVVFLAKFYYGPDLHPDDYSSQGLEIVKYQYELASRIWVALVSVLAALFFGKDLFPSKGA
jgi:hypothetical protein